LSGLSRWCGVLEVASKVYRDSTPIYGNPDAFVLRFKVIPRVVLSPEQSIPIIDDEIWPHLSTTRNMAKAAFGWAQAANMRASLREMNPLDGELLLNLLNRQARALVPYPLSTRDQRKVAQKHAIRAADRSVIVEVPDDEEDGNEVAEVAEPTSQSELRESHRIQGILAQMGIDMGFRVWIPRSDRATISKLIRAEGQGSLIEVLPLNYDDATLKTVEQIDVIWLKNRSMARAFEVEHTTAIYSGLLRMADLLALQPNMDIRLHIVAPDEKRDKVLREIKRPVFSLLDRGPLYESCSFIPYGAIDEIAKMKHLAHMSDSILEELSRNQQRTLEVQVRRIFQRTSDSARC
jgi:hypothetical protein